MVPTLPMLDASLSVMRASALIAAERIGMSEALAGGFMEPCDLPLMLDVSELGLGRLADLLVATGQLERRGTSGQCPRVCTLAHQPG